MGLQGVKTHRLRNFSFMRVVLAFNPWATSLPQRSFLFPTIHTYLDTWVNVHIWGSLTLIFMSKCFLPICRCLFVCFPRGLGSSVPLWLSATQLFEKVPGCECKDPLHLRPRSLFALGGSHECSGLVFMTDLFHTSWFMSSGAYF